MYLIVPIYLRVIGYQLSEDNFERNITKPNIVPVGSKAWVDIDNKFLFINLTRWVKNFSFNSSKELKLNFSFVPFMQVSNVINLYNKELMHQS